MAFDNPTRNRLARLVSDCRRLLTDEFSIQLQQHYGIQPDGQIIPLEQLGHLDDEQRGVAVMLRERISHIASGLTDEKRPAEAAVDRLLREQAFTVLNRFRPAHVRGARAGAGVRARWLALPRIQGFFADRGLRAR